MKRNCLGLVIAGLFFVLQPASASAKIDSTTNTNLVQGTTSTVTVRGQYVDLCRRFNESDPSTVSGSGVTARKKATPSPTNFFQEVDVTLNGENIGNAGISVQFGSISGATAELRSSTDTSSRERRLRALIHKGKPGDPVKISGNWFRTFGTTEMPTVNFGSAEAEVINVASLLNMTVRMPDLSCTASGQVSVTVTNSRSATAFRDGPTFPGPLNITSTSRIASPRRRARKWT